MDARLTTEQRELGDAAARLAGDLGPGSVHDLADDGRVARLEKAVAATGGRTLRSDGGTGVGAALPGADLTRQSAQVTGPLEPAGELSGAHAGRWRALALVVTTADLLGTARGAHALACDYAKVRTQYGKPI